MKKQKLMKQPNSQRISNPKTMEKRKSETAKKIMGKKPTYVSLLLISLLPTIASLLQTGQITMAVNVYSPTH